MVTNNINPGNAKKIAQIQRALAELLTDALRRGFFGTAAIEIGDLVWQDTDDAKPASAQADQGSETANQARFAQKFLGVAMQRSRAADTAPIRVATTGVFELDSPSGAFELGDLVGADENAAGNALLDQQVAKVSQSQYAIGRVARREPAASTRVLVDVRSTVMTGGVAGGTTSGT